MSESYYDIKKLKEVRETNKKLRKQFLRYQEAEIVYSIQHKKLLELASRAALTIIAYIITIELILLYMIFLMNVKSVYYTRPVKGDVEQLN